MINFRRLTLKDVKTTYTNRLRALELAPAAFLTTLEEEKARGITFLGKILSIPGEDNIILGAVENDTVIGTVGILRGSKTKNKHKATIYGMYVEPEKRKQGIGSKLLDLAVNHARKKMKVEMINLSVNSDNSEAIALYKSRGFNCWGTEVKSMCYQGDYNNESHFVLNLEVSWEKHQTGRFK